MNETVETLDASLQDFEPPASPMPPETSDSDFDSQDQDQDQHRDQDLPDSEAASVGGFSPPAWRTIARFHPDHHRVTPQRGGDLWRGPVDALGPLPMFDPMKVPVRDAEVQQDWMRKDRSEYTDEDTSHSEDATSHFEDDLLRAIKTKLPRGSVSPVKGRSPSPERDVKVKESKPEEKRHGSQPPPDNYIRFAVRAQVQQRTEPIDLAINCVRNIRKSLPSFRFLLVLCIFLLPFSLLASQRLFQPPAPRPAGDLVKVAGLARSFEPLIYYSEHALSQVHELQATSVAVWDLGESIRGTDMKDAASIVSDLDTLSGTMKTLAEEMTRFFARVDGDIDSILNMMDWAKMHLARVRRTVSHQPLSYAYDNLHNFLLDAQILEDSTGTPTALGTATAWVFGDSGSQRQQQAVQFVFHEFLTVLEEAIESELQHSITLFVLFESIDRQFLNLARTAVRETSAQEILHADLLSGLWSKILGPRADQLRKYEKNRLLLQNVREKTVRNKGVLVEHNGKLLTLKASLEALRGKLVSPLLSAANSTTLPLEDQITGISGVSEYLTEVRRRQKGKILESLYGNTPGRKFMIEPSYVAIGR